MKVPFKNSGPASPLLGLHGQARAERVAAEVARFTQAGVPADALAPLMQLSKRLAFGAENPEPLGPDAWPKLHSALADSASAHEWLEAWARDVLTREVNDRKALEDFARVVEQVGRRVALAEGLLSANRAAKRGDIG